MGRMEKARRRELISDYKERRSRPGVFVLRRRATGETWIGGSRAIDSQVNSLMFSLRHGSHRHKGLQAAWNTDGEAGFEYEIVEALDDQEMTPIGRADWLKARLAHWTAELGAQSATA